MSTEDCRTPGAMRFPFEGLVEVGGALGPSFEAQAVNVSEDGMQLRTTYLPEAGQPLTCRFDVGQGESVLVSGEVVWARGAKQGGEFGIRFTDLDAESVAALKRAGALPSHPDEGLGRGFGGKVRLHIDGLASPMRAKVKNFDRTAITVGSNLGFLQVGKALELEDATSGNKRPASIDRVEVAVDPDSRVPQLVVTLRYTDMAAEAEGHAAVAARPSTAMPTQTPDDMVAGEEAVARMKGVVARQASRAGAALSRLGQRAKTTIGLLAKRGRRPDEAASIRRTTSPPLGGGLHATGRRVVRGDGAVPAAEEGATPPGVKMTRRKAAVATAVMLSAIVGALVLKKSHHDAAPEVASTTAHETPASVAPSAAASNQPAPSAMPPAAPPADSASAAAHEPNATAAADDNTDALKAAHKHHVRPAPFGNGPVHHGNVLRLKMDAPVEVIEGAEQPNGFAVKLPGRKALEAAGPLAARDSRIAAIKVSNDPSGAELTVAFRDGVPNYQVSARGDNLVIALAQMGNLEATTAKRDEKGSKGSTHRKHAH